MSKRKFLLSLADGYITLEVLQAPSARSLRTVWQRALAYLRGEAPPNYRVIETRTLTGDTRGPGLAILFQKGLDTVKTLATTPEEHLLDVVLGPTLSRVGVMAGAAADEPLQWSNAERDAYVQAWIAQNWGMQAEACAVRSAPVGNRGRHLVTCIEGSVVQTIETLCKQANLHLASCTPALAHQLSKLLSRRANRSEVHGLPPSRALRFCVFVQTASDGGRAPVVHFVVLDAGEPLSITRMWLPDTKHPNPKQLYQSVVDRLRTQYRNSMAPEVEVVVWPTRESLACIP